MTARTRDVRIFAKDAPMTQVNKAEATVPLCENRPEDEVEVEEKSSLSRNSAPVLQRRAQPRYRVELDVSLGTDQNFYVGFVENLSMSGVFIATHMLKAVGDVFEFTVHLPSAPSAVHGMGEVRWVREYSERSNVPPGMGIRFVSLEQGGDTHIENFLARREPAFFDDI